MTTATTPFTGTYTLDPVHSSFGFAVRYQGISLFRGTLNDVSAKLTDGRLEGSARVESISIRTPEQFRAHVLSEEFFDVEHYPEVQLVSTDIDFADDATVKMTADLTIKGITRRIEASGHWVAPAVDAFDRKRGHIQLEALIDRTEFNMNWNVALPSGGKALDNEVTLSAEIALIEKE